MGEKAAGRNFRQEPECTVMRSRWGPTGSGNEASHCSRDGTRLSAYRLTFVVATFK